MKLLEPKPNVNLAFSWLQFIKDKRPLDCVNVHVGILLQLMQKQTVIL